MTRITINGREVDADPTRPLIHACHRESVDVPMYCYHPGLSPVGSCRICQVQVQQGEMPPRIVVACRTPITPDMVVDTEAPKAHDARRECLEFLLKNHPLDCPICDKAGECDLQDYAFAEQQGQGRSHEGRRKLEKRKSLGDVILLDQERCILCSRCVRFMEEVPKTPELTVSGLGSHSVISTFMDRPLSGNYQGNLADICPVGALTLKDFRFQARVWNLRKSSSTCAECSRGCSITTEVLRGGEVKRFRPRFNPDVNGYWMCDVGRFATDRANGEDRLAGALVRGYQNLEACDAQDALESIADLLASKSEVFVAVSPFITVEEGERVAALARALRSDPCFVSPPPNDLKDDILHTGDPCPNRRGLEELGFRAVSAEDAFTRILETPVSLLLGERLVESLGAEKLSTVPSGSRVVLFETRALDGPAVHSCVGIPDCVERFGTWVNIDGHRGRIAQARPAPAGVWTLTSNLDSLIDLLDAVEDVKREENGAPAGAEVQS